MPDSNRYRLLHGGLILLTLILAVGSLCLGQYRLSVSNVLSQLLMLATPDGPAGQIVWSVRLPRILMALLAGGALACAAQYYRGYFKIRWSTRTLLASLPVRRLAARWLSCWGSARW
jgi:iron complex transport system permease protein